jgi:hypothetical protein
MQRIGAAPSRLGRAPLVLAQKSCDRIILRTKVSEAPVKPWPEAEFDAHRIQLVVDIQFYRLVDGSVNPPDGWKFISEESGRTPAMGGYTRWYFRWIFRARPTSPGRRRHS